MKARDCLFHQDCFSCALCKCVLSTGEYFGMQDDHIYCKLHFEQTVDSFNSSPDDMTSSSLTPIHDTDHSGMPRHDFLPDFQTSHIQHQNMMQHSTLADLIPGLGPPLGPNNGQMGPGHPHMGRSMGPGPTPFYNGVGVTKKGRPRSRKNQQHHHHDLPLLCECTCASSLHTESCKNNLISLKIESFFCNEL